MTPNPTLPAARQWSQSQSKRRKAFAIGGLAAVMLIGANAAAGDQESATEAAPTTTAPISRAHVSPSTTTVTTHAPTTTATATVPPTTAAPTTAPPTTLPVTYTVIAVIDGDTIDVVASDGSPGFRVRMIGIDAPETGSCEADAVTWTLTSLVQDQQVSLLPGGDGEDTDRYGRLLRYVDVNGVDAGLRLIEDGLAIARYDSRDGYGMHAREASYVTADEAAPDYACPPPTTQAPPAPPPPPPAPLPAVVPPAAPSRSGNGCDPNYTPCVPIDSDVDCASGSGNGPSYVNGPVRVIGTDIYGLDGNDNDGIGCE